MKKLFLLSISLMAVLFLFAQPALTYVRPPYGTQKVYGMSVGSMPDPAEGQDQLWDYSSYYITAFGSGVYTDVSALPASSKNKFPTATYVEVWDMPTTIEKTVIDYYLESGDSLVKLGQQSSGGSSSSTWGYVVGVWNVAYGGSINARYMDPTTGRYMLTAFKYAGYGTLKTKWGTYNNVVMIKNSGNVYFYQTTPYVAMLMNIAYSAPGTVAGAYIYRYIDGNTSGMKDLANTKKTTISSAPGTHEVSIKISEFTEKCKVEVFDLVGKVVYNNVLNFNATPQKFVVENINNGFYIVKVSYNNSTDAAKVYLAK
jgi:hypothetical protein